jgi:hypothetical protein
MFGLECHGIRAKVIVKFLTNESVGAHEIHARSTAQFGEQTYGFARSNSGCVRYNAAEKLHDEHRSGRPAPDCINTKIVSILEKAPFEFAPSIAQALNVDHAAMLHCLHEKLGFKSYCLRWGSHLLTGELRAKRKELTGLTIPSLEAARRDG